MEDALRPINFAPADHMMIWALIRQRPLQRLCRMSALDRDARGGERRSGGGVGRWRHEPYLDLVPTRRGAKPILGANGLRCSAALALCCFGLFIR